VGVRVDGQVRPHFHHSLLTAHPLLPSFVTNSSRTCSGRTAPSASRRDMKYTLCCDSLASCSTKYRSLAVSGGPPASLRRRGRDPSATRRISTRHSSRADIDARCSWSASRCVAERATSSPLNVSRSVECDFAGKTARQLDAASNHAIKATQRTRMRSNVKMTGPLTLTAKPQCAFVGPCRLTS
jgi:hypothetical protein